MYPLLNALVAPRPIAWVSTRSADGVDNLAPHSYFTVVSTAPPIVAFTSIGTKDTLRNARTTGQLVVNHVARSNADACNVCGTDYPPDVSEFDAAGLTREPSERVLPPRVAESAACLECEVHDVVPVGNGHFIMAEVLLAVVRSDLVPAEGGAPAVATLDPASRLGASDWGALGEVFSLRRIPYSEVAGER
jgi:flavin reductase (DIM6/NTAB) family NADH-FMN oxidoreductase RutF